MMEFYMGLIGILMLGYSLFVGGLLYVLYTEFKS